MTNQDKKPIVNYFTPKSHFRGSLYFTIIYIIRVVISDKNSLNFHNDRITFRFKDTQTNSIKTRSLDATEFIYHFLQHILSKKVRYFGFLATKKRNELAYVKERIGKRLKIDIDDSVSNEKVMKCPDCGHVLIFVSEIPKTLILLAIMQER